MGMCAISGIKLGWEMNLENRIVFLLYIRRYRYYIYLNLWRLLGSTKHSQFLYIYIRICIVYVRARGRKRPAWRVSGHFRCVIKGARGQRSSDHFFFYFSSNIYIYICYSLSSPHISYSRMTILRYVAPVSDNTYKDDFIGLFYFFSVPYIVGKSENGCRCVGGFRTQIYIIHFYIKYIV